MKRTLFSCLLILIVLTACSKSGSVENYYVALSGESEHWKVTGYEISQTSETFRVGNGMLTKKDTDDTYMGNFLSFDTYIVVDGKEEKLQAYSVAGDADIAEQNLGTVEEEDKVYKDFSKVEAIYGIVTWNDEETDGDMEEKLLLYEKTDNKASLLKDM